MLFAFSFSWQNTDQTESSVKQICYTQLTRKRHENRDLGLKEKSMLRAYNYHSGQTVSSKVGGKQNLWHTFLTSQEYI